MDAHVDGGLGVLDDRAVLDVTADLPVAGIGRLGDVIEGTLADHGVGAHPEGGVKVGQALVDDVLQVRGGAGDPLQPGGGARECAVGRLGDGHIAVLTLLEQVHQPQAVLRQQHAVRIQRHDVVGAGNNQVTRRWAGADQRQAGSGRHLAIAAAHQADVAVEVHGLVGLVGERDVALALEAGDLGTERPYEAAVQAADLRPPQHHLLGGRGPQRRGDRAQRFRQPEHHLVGEEDIRVVDDLPGGGQVLQPCRGSVVVAGEAGHRADTGILVAAGTRLELLQRIGEVGRRLRQQLLDLARERPGRGQQLPCPRGSRHKRVVDQQDDALVGVLLERCRQQRVADDARLLLVGGDDRGQRRRLGIEKLVQDGAARPVTVAGPVAEAEPAQQVGQGGSGQYRDGEQVDDRFRPVDRARVARVEEVLKQPCDEVAEPRRYRDDDGQAAQGDPPVTDGLRNHGHRLDAPVAAPLAAGRGGLAAGCGGGRWRGPSDGGGSGVDGYHNAPFMYYM